MTAASLLPPNATPFMRAMEGAPAFGSTFAAIETMVGAKFDPPDSWLPYLLYEYGLGELLPYLDDPRRAIREGVLWQRARGTPAALKTAFGWRGFGSATIEESAPGRRFYEFQVDPGKIAIGGENADLVGLAALSAPVRSRLVRLYHGLDRREFRLSESRLSHGDLLSGWSGVWDSALQVWLSYGERRGGSIDHDGVAVAASARIGASVTVHSPALGFRLSASSLSGPAHFWPATTGGAVDVKAGTPPAGIDFAGGQAGARLRPRSHVGLSCTRFGEIHHRFGGYATENHPFRLSESGLSRSRSAIIRHPIMAVSATRDGGAATLTAPPRASAGGRLGLAATTPRGGSYPRLSHPVPPGAAAAALATVTLPGSVAAYADAMWSDAPWSDDPWPVNPVTIGTSTWLS